MNAADCPVCGAPQSGGAPEGLCPACLLGAGIGAADEALLGEQAGELVDSYRLLKKVGEGAFGWVFHARQEQPVKRDVALKILKPGMDSRAVVARFRQESDALALMDHPGIAKIFDAGTTPYGRPYFVMEYVADGESLTRYCDRNKLGLRDRLGLFARVCEAVQHAHQKGIIHRDLKPSNILVTTGSDGKPFARVIDFGVAKALGPSLGESFSVTLDGQVVGTLAYMSPEQARFNTRDVDTTSDIYSLGAVLYELLTGHTPFEKEDLEQAGVEDMRRMIGEKEPSRPSKRIRSMPEEELRKVAERRGTEPGRLVRRVQGDLDRIILKALEKRRSKRYRSADDLAENIGNYLNGLPVDPPPLADPIYKAKKWVKRHRGPAVAIGLGFLGLIGAAVGAWKYNGDMRVKNEQLRRERDQKTFEELKAQVEAVESSRGEESGSLEEGLQKLEMVGKKDLNALWIAKEKARVLRSDARDVLIACLAWTDMQRKSVLGDPLAEDWMPAAFDEAQQNCALGYADGRVEVREVDGGRVRNQLAGGHGPLNDLRFSPDGRLVAACFGKGEKAGLLLWGWEEQSETVTVVDGASAYDFHPPGGGLAVAGPDGTVRLTGLDGLGTTTLPAMRSRPVVLRFSPDGRRLAVGLTSGSVEILDLSDGSPVREWAVVSPVSLAWSPDGATLAVGGADGAVTLLDPESESPFFDEIEHLEPVEQLAWSHDGRLLASGSGDETIRLWDGRQGRLQCRFTALARTLSFSPDDAFLGPVLGGARQLERLKVHRIPACHRAAGHRGQKSVTAAAWRGNENDGLVLATAAGDGIRFWNHEGTQLAFLPGVEVSEGGLAWTDSHVYVSGAGGISWCTASIKGGKLVLGPLSPFAALSDPGQIILGPFGTFLAAASEDKVVIFDPITRLRSKVLHGLPSTVSVAASPDGRFLAAGTRDRGVRVWRLADQRQQDLPGAQLSTVAFYPFPFNPVTKVRMALLMTGDTEGYQAWLWDEGEERWVGQDSHPSLMSTANPQGRVPRIVVSPRGTASVIAYNLKYLRILNPLTLQEMAQPNFDEQWPLAVSPDGRMMATGAARGRLCIWNLEEVRHQLALRGLDWSRAQDGVHLPGFDPPMPPLVLP